MQPLPSLVKNDMATTSACMHSPMCQHGDPFAQPLPAALEHGQRQPEWPRPGLQQQLAM
jgi:hypothetical protein